VFYKEFDLKRNAWDKEKFRNPIADNNISSGYSGSSQRKLTTLNKIKQRNKEELRVMSIYKQRDRHKFPS